jgi:hypothetical protein
VERDIRTQQTTTHPLNCRVRRRVEVGERSKENQEEGHTCTMAGGCHVSRVDFEGCAFVLDYCTHM